MEILKELFKLQDLKYASFQSKLTPNVPSQMFIGVRVPALRKLAKEYANTKEAEDFLNTLPHNYFDEYMLHVLIVSEIKDYDRAVEEVEKILPYVDNWAVCDILSPKIFKKNKEKVLGKIQEWINSDKAYTCRFGIEMLMSHFLDEDFKEEYLEFPIKIKSNEYYVNMMIAWFLATALAKQWDSTIKIIEAKTLNSWVQNKTIQKAIESYRISPENKEYLKGLKIKNV